MREELRNRKINYFVHFKLDNSEEHTPNKKEIRDNSVNMLTIHQSKGLEFDVVILIDPIHALMNRLPQESDIQHQNNLMYVAVTRAKHQLHMFVTGENMPHTALIEGLSTKHITPYISL